MTDPVPLVSALKPDNNAHIDSYSVLYTALDLTQAELVVELIVNELAPDNEPLLSTMCSAGWSCVELGARKEIREAKVYAGSPRIKLIAGEFQRKIIG